MKQDGSRIQTSTGHDQRFAHECVCADHRTGADHGRPFELGTGTDDGTMTD